MAEGAVGVSAGDAFETSAGWPAAGPAVAAPVALEAGALEAAGALTMVAVRPEVTAQTITPMTKAIAAVAPPAIARITPPLGPALFALPRAELPALRSGPPEARPVAAGGGTPGSSSSSKPAGAAEGEAAAGTCSASPHEHFTRFPAKASRAL
ncbi:MAG TPA: hypothetical protein VGX78_05100 [Pirellulales bacterium]|nr:hypothetical protein [Pirellulales bacterium]